MFKLHKEEKVILYIRRHWIFLFLDAVAVFIIFLIPLFFIYIAQYLFAIPNIFLLGVSIYEIANILIILWALFCWMLLAEKFTDYALDFWVVTNKRLIESELIKLFDVQLSTLELQDIEDITVRSEGFLANLFGFGRLEVQTAGAVNEFFADKIMNPTAVQKILFDAKLTQNKEEKDIEKGELEQISKRVFKEEEMSSNKTATINNDNKFDWAHINDKDELEAIEKETGYIEEKYKKDILNALKSGE